MTESQASNLISRGREAFNDFIKVKDAFTAFAADYFNLEAATELTQEHFTGANAGLDLATFHQAFQAMAAVLQSTAVATATKPVYKIGRP